MYNKINKLNHIMKILAIETSCDDTSIAIVDCKNDINNIETKLLASVVSSQTKLHARSGGIIPNLAAREHEKNLLPVFKQALKTAKIKDFNKEIDLITVTRGPGLQPALLMGLNFAKALAYTTKKPIIGTNHLLGHIFSNFIQHEGIFKNNIKLPVVCLLVSGGHTQLYKISNWDNIKMVGETLDDASGECFDKIAKMLNLGYPGGVYISKTAEKFRLKNPGYKSEFKLPKPLMYSKDFNFSFSGLKTSVLYLIQRLKKSKKFNKKVVEKLCTEAEDVITDVLVSKTIKLAKSIDAKTIMISGGVSANQRLRDKFEKTISNEFDFICPAKSMSTDNAAMIAVAGYYEHFRRKNDDCLTLEINSNLQI